MAESCSTDSLPSIAGLPGIDGFHAFNRLKNAATQGAVGANILFTMQNIVPWTVNFVQAGAPIVIPNVGFYTVVSVGVSAGTFLATRITGDTMPEVLATDPIVSGSYVYIGSPKGAVGAAGAAGAAGANGQDGIIVHAIGTTPTALGSVSGSWETLADIDVTTVFTNQFAGVGLKLEATFDMQNAAGTTVVTPALVRVLLGPDVANARIMNLPNEVPMGGVLYVATGTVIGGVVPGRLPLFASGGRLHLRINRTGNNASGVESDGWSVPDGEPAGSSIFANQASTMHIPRNVVGGGVGVTEVNMTGTIRLFIQYKRESSANTDLIRLNTFVIDKYNKTS